MDDAAVIARLLAGDAATVREVRAWIRAAASPYRSRLAEELEDLEQEILLDLTLSLRTGAFRSESSFRTYVRTHVHHQCIDRLRSHGRRQWIAIDDLALPSPAPSALEAIDSAQTARVALKVMQAMPEGCRELWAMLEEGLSYREMSQRLDVAEGALRARVLRCRRRALELREELLARRGAAPR